MLTKKWMSLALILLFIGMGFAPATNAMDAEEPPEEIGKMLFRAKVTVIASDDEGKMVELYELHGYTWQNGTMEKIDFTLSVGYSVKILEPFIGFRLPARNGRSILIGYCAGVRWVQG